MLDRQQRRWLRFLAVLVGYVALGALVLWTLWQIRAIWPPFFVAFVIAIALAPVVDRLEARGWPRGLATATIYLGLLACMGGLLFVLVPLVSGQIGQIVTDLRVRFRLDEPADISRTMVEQVRLFGRENQVPRWLLQPVVQQAKQSATLLTDNLARFGAFLIGLAPSLIWLVLVPVVAFYALIDYHRIFAKVLLMVPRTSRDDFRSVAADVTVVFGKYLRGLGIICLLNAIATIGVLFLFQPTRPYAAALGLIAGILYAVPYLGAILSTSLISLVALAGPGGSFSMLLIVTLAMVFLHQILFDQVLAPRVLGGHVGLHPILSIMALMGGGTLFGIGGVLLAVPIAASIQVVVLHVVPRLSKRIDVKMQTGVPETTDTEQTQALSEGKTDALEHGVIVVTAGEGVVGKPEKPSAAT